MSFWSGSLALFAVLEVPCAPLPEQPPAASTLPENHDSLLLPSLLLPADDCPDGLALIWLSLSCSSTVPPREPCILSSLTFGPHPWVSALERFCGGFPSTLTTHSLLLLVRLYFSSCFHTHLTFMAPTSHHVGQVGCCVIPLLTFTTLDCVDYYIKNNSLGAGASSLVADV